MNQESLRRLGRRCVGAGLGIIPVHIVLIALFWRWSHDAIGTFSLTMSLAMVSVALIAFGLAALSSSKEE